MILICAIFEWAGISKPRASGDDPEAADNTAEAKE